MNRREFIQCAAMLSAGATVVPTSWTMSAEQSAFLAARPAYIDQYPLTFFTAPQRLTVAAVAEHIIPATDTPGAIDAGVPRFIELMVADWLTPAERTLFMAGLTDLQQRGGDVFTDLSGTAQLAVLEQLEEASSDAAWYEMGNIMRMWDSEAPFICQFKELTVLGFFLSKVGAEQVLRINPMGTFNGDMPLAKEDAAYAAELPLRLMARGQVS